MSTPRAGLRPARPSRGQANLGVARRLLVRLQAWAALIAPGARARWLVLAIGAGALAGCATPPPARPPDLLVGRLAVRIDSVPPRGVSAGFELSGSAEQGRLVLAGPLGTTAGEARWDAASATLRAGGTEHDYADLDALAVQTLGEHIPIAALFDWLRGRAWRGEAFLPRSDGGAGFEQLGWQISLARFDDGWVEARRSTAPAVTVRVQLERP